MIMDKQKIIIISNILVIILVITACGIMLHLSKLIKSDGGKCTASPEAYGEMKLKEKYGKDFTCKCTEKTYDFSLDNLPNITLP